MGDPVYTSSTTAPVNIAVIKYWGKRDVALNLPTNSSLSVTLAQADLRTHTTAACSARFARDRLVLRGQAGDAPGARAQACFDELRALRAARETADPALPRLASLRLLVVSENNFPTAAGLASSAAGLAALVRAVADLYALPHSPEELSRIARMGSGSACRSLLGGFVAWEAGVRADGTDSLAAQVAPAAHWSQLRAAVLVASAARKAVPSTAGMQATVATSALFAHRVRAVVPGHMAAMRTAIAHRDFASFASLTMADSNSFHAVCLDTQPPIFYLTDVSRAAIRAVEEINRLAAAPIAAYTFDAGPNAVVYYLEPDGPRILGALHPALAGVPGWPAQPPPSAAAPDGSVLTLDEALLQPLRDGIARVILTGVGEGPVKVDDSLVDAQGEPVFGTAD